MTPADIAALRGLCEAAPERITQRLGHGGPTESEQFYEAARSALPALLDEVERLAKILDDRMCKECGGQGEWCVDRCYGNEHYHEMEKCHACNGDGRTEPGAVAEIQRLTARLRECEAERDAARAQREATARVAIETTNALTAARDKLRALLREACGKLAGYVGHRRGVLLHIEATCEDDADLAEARRELKTLDAEAARLAAIAREGGVE